jgi:lipid A 3-O-deacylase
MKRSAKISCLNLSVLLAFAAFRGSAQVQPSASADSGGVSVEDNFHRGWHEATFGAGFLISNVVRADNRPNIDYTVIDASVGYMVWTPNSGGFFRGNLELAPEIFGAYVFHGPGNYVAGATLWLRYNFVQPGWKLVPYLEGGGGGTALDIPDKFDGKIFNFNLDAAIGLRYFVEPRCSVNVEYRFQHISNADLWSHNVGVNTTGPFVGVSFFF